MTENVPTTRQSGEIWTMVKRMRPRCRSRKWRIVERARWPLLAIHGRDARSPARDDDDVERPLPVVALLEPAGPEPGADAPE
jgi:hypothetical protein